MKYWLTKIAWYYEVALALVKEGRLRYVIKEESTKKEELINYKMGLKYVEGAPVIENIKVGTEKVYLSVKDLETKVNRPFEGNKEWAKVEKKAVKTNYKELWLVTTPAGILTDKEAVEKKVGGQLVLRVD